jgi:hypothetical protein
MVDCIVSAQTQKVLGWEGLEIAGMMAVNGLYHKLSAEPPFTAYGFTFGPMKDKTTVALQLNPGIATVYFQSLSGI